VGPVSGELVLIVEDDQRSRKLLRDLLQFHGYRTLEAANGSAALILAQGSRPQLVLLDIRLPDMDGVAVLLKLRDELGLAEVPMVAVTASVMRGDEQRFLRAGFDGYIPKPINVASLPGQVRQYLDLDRST
jgi:CheY-like chemotaxis protein